MGKFIHDDDIDETAARTFLNDFYRGVDLLPSIPGTVTRQSAASILNVSMPTIDRMLQDKSITLTRESILNYIMENFLVNYPVHMDDEDEMKTHGIELSDKELEAHKKAFDDIDEITAPFHKDKHDHQDEQSLFSEEDLKQEEK